MERIHQDILVVYVVNVTIICEGPLGWPRIHKDERVSGISKLSLSRNDPGLVDDLSDSNFVLLSKVGPEFVIRNFLALLGGGSVLVLVALHPLIHFLVLALVHALIVVLFFLFLLVIATLVLLHIGLVFVAPLCLHSTLVLIFVLLFIVRFGFLFLCLRGTVSVLRVDACRSCDQQQEHYHT